MRGRIDAIVRAALTPKEVEALTGLIANCEDIKVQHIATTEVETSQGVLSAFNMREAGRERFLGANGLYLAPGVIYESADRKVINTRAIPKLGSTLVDWAAKLVVTGLRIPNTLLAALPGRHITTVVDLPCLRDPRLIIVDIWRNKLTMVKSRAGPQGAPVVKEVTSFSVTLPQLLDDLV